MRRMQCGRVHDRVDPAQRTAQQEGIAEVAGQVHGRGRRAIDADHVVFAQQPRVDGPADAPRGAGDEHFHAAVAGRGTRRARFDGIALSTGFGRDMCGMTPSGKTNK